MAQSKSNEVYIEPLKVEVETITLIGQTPLIYNAMSTKAKQTLLAGGGKKTAAEKKELKHDPVQEFDECVYRHVDDETLLAFPAPAIKGAMATAALETAGVTKSSVQRLVFLPQQQVRIWGTPHLRCDVVRSADMNKTPDVRTRACLHEWMTEVEIQYVVPTLSYHSVLSLLTNAGAVCGIGDFRQEKGRGGFGTFRVANPADPVDAAIIERLKGQGKAAQQAAMASAEPHPNDLQTIELLDFIMAEKQRRAA